MFLPIIIIVFWLLPSIGCTSGDGVGLRNILVEQGQSVTLTCNATLRGDVIWLFQPSLKDSYVYVYSNGMVYESHRTRFKVDGDESAGQYRLTISDVQLSDSGIYTCKEDGGFGESHMFHVSVPSKHLVRDVLSEADNISLSFTDELTDEAVPQSSQTTVIAVTCSVLILIFIGAIVLVVYIRAVFRKRKTKTADNKANESSRELLNGQAKSNATMSGRDDVEMNKVQAKQPSSLQLRRPQKPPRSADDPTDHGHGADVESQNRQSVHKLTTVLFELFAAPQKIEKYINEGLLDEMSNCGFTADEIGQITEADENAAKVEVIRSLWASREVRSS